MTRLQRARQGGYDIALPGERAARGPEPPRTPARAPGPVAIELTPLLAAVRPLLDGARGANRSIRRHRGRRGHVHDRP